LAELECKADTNVPQIRFSLACTARQLNTFARSQVSKNSTTQVGRNQIEQYAEFMQQ